MTKPGKNRLKQIFKKSIFNNPPDMYHETCFLTYRSQGLRCRNEVNYLKCFLNCSALDDQRPDGQLNVEEDYDQCDTFIGGWEQFLPSHLYSSQASRSSESSQPYRLGAGGAGTLLFIRKHGFVFLEPLVDRHQAPRDTHVLVQPDFFFFYNS